MQLSRINKIEPIEALKDVINRQCENKKIEVKKSHKYLKYLTTYSYFPFSKTLDPRRNDLFNKKRTCPCWYSLLNYK